MSGVFRVLDDESSTMMEALKDDSASEEWRQEPKFASMSRSILKANNQTRNSITKDINNSTFNSNAKSYK